MIIYLITNAVNGKRYIGMTEGSLKARWNVHTKRMREGCDTALYCAMRKYGVEHFAMVELARLPVDSDRNVLCDLERSFIANEGTLAPGGYNMTAGGDGQAAGKNHPLFGKKMSAEWHAAVKASWTPERRAKNSAKRAETNRKMNQSLEHKAKLKAAWDRSPERREATSKRMAANRASGLVVPRSGKRDIDERIH